MRWDARWEERSNWVRSVVSWRYFQRGRSKLGSILLLKRLAGEGLAERRRPEAEGTDRNGCVFTQSAQKEAKGKRAELTGLPRLSVVGDTSFVPLEHE